MLLILYLYTHELSHIILKHNVPSYDIEVQADMSAGVYIFTRIKGGWYTENENGKIKATIEPLLRLLEFITRLYPDQMGERLFYFMRNYLWADTIFSNGTGVSF